MRGDDESFAEAVATFRRLAEQAQRLLEGADRLVVPTGVQIVGGHDLVTASVVRVLREMRLDARDGLGEIGRGGGGFLPSGLERLVRKFRSADLQIEGERGGRDQRDEPEGDPQPQPSRAVARRRVPALSRRQQAADELELRRFGVLGAQSALRALALGFRRFAGRKTPGRSRQCQTPRSRRRAAPGARDRREQQDTRRRPRSCMAS